MTTRNFVALIHFIIGRAFDLAQQILGLTDGKKPNDPEHHQPCPIPGCASDDDGFYCRKNKGTFHCRKCGFNGNIIDLVAAVREISNTEAFDIVAEAVGYESGHPPTSETLPKSKYRTMYTVSASADSILVADLSQKEVSVYPNCWAKTPSGTLTIETVLDMFRTGGESKELIEAVRNEADKDRRNELKKGLPAVVFGSEPQTERNNAACTANGVICLDFDGIPEDKLESVKLQIAALPYVFAVGLSVSGTGFFALAHYKGTPDFKVLIAAIQAIFPSGIDKSRSDVCGLRYITFDPDIIIKDEVFPAILTEQADTSSASARCLSTGTPDIVLNPKEPLASADTFIRVIYSFHGTPTLIHYAGDYWQWKRNGYRCVETGEIKNRLLHFTERAQVEHRGNDDEPMYKPFPVLPHNLNSIEEMLKRRIFKSAEDAVPCWIGGTLCEMPSSVTDPSLLIFGKSKILNLADMGILSPSPHWLNTASLEFDYDPNAECPLWLAFLDSIFEDDEESKQTLMEWMGLCLTPITKFQKALFLVGQKRSGKGTIARMLQKNVGKHNTASPSASDFGSEFGLAPLIGKTLAIVGDARFKGGISPSLTERVLNITGEDEITINRKHKDHVHIRLKTKLMFISNEVPNIIDQSGALASRFIFLKLPKTFFGREDIELESKLSRELPGILRFSVQHLQNLLERGYFIQPETGIASAKQMMALSSPVGEFVHKLCPYMTKNAIWEKWEAFCNTEGQRRYGTKGALWNNLDAAGYTCDFDTADILEAIRENGKKARVRDLQQSSGKYRGDGGAEELDRRLRKMVKDGLLVIRRETAKNGRDVEWFCIPTKTDAK